MRSVPRAGASPADGVSRAPVADRDDRRSRFGSAAVPAASVPIKLPSNDVDQSPDAMRDPVLVVAGDQVSGRADAADRVASRRLTSRCPSQIAQIRRAGRRRCRCSCPTRCCRAGRRVSRRSGVARDDVAVGGRRPADRCLSPVMVMPMQRRRDSAEHPCRSVGADPVALTTEFVWHSRSSIPRRRSG